MDYEYLAGDKELFDMMARKTPTDRKTVGVVVPVRRAKKLEKLEWMMDWIQKIASIVSSALVAAVFLAATILGWMEMIFGAVATLAAVARAIVLYWRYRHGSK